MKRILQSGLTLIELIVVIGIIGAIATALSVFVADNFRFQSLTLTEGESYGEAQRTVDKMKREIRGLTEAENGAFAIANADSQTLTIYADYDFDGRIERLRYYLNGTTLYKGIIEPQSGADTYPTAQENSTLITRDVANGGEALFLYYDASYSGTQPPMSPPVEPEIRVIGIHLVTDSTPGTTAGRYVVDTVINLRNL